MLKHLRKLWANAEEPAQSDSLPLAVAALLVEVMRMDGRLEASEQRAVVTALKGRFQLPDHEIAALIDDARHATEQSHDLHRFTSRITHSFSSEERIDIIRELWLIAMADGQIDPYEEQLIRRTAELIGVYHHEFIHAKLMTHRAPPKD